MIRLRRIQLDEIPTLVAAAQSARGQLAVVAVSALGLWLSFRWTGLVLALLLFAVSWEPNRRRGALSVLAAALCLRALGGYRGCTAIWLIAAAGLFVAALWLWRLYLPGLRGWPSRRPLLLLHAGTAGVIAALWACHRLGLAGASTAALISLVSELLWRGSYWVKWGVRNRDSRQFSDYLFTLIPFAGHGGVPFGKGAEYVSRFEARDARELAAARLRGLQLLALAAAWRGLLMLLEPAPSMTSLLEAPAVLPLWERWTVLVVELLRDILALAGFGHSVVALYCLAGFRIPRNTDAPLFATTILDFWTRYYFYFKELVMDFFFFPAYFRAKGMSPRARTVLATFAAAFAGNLYYHLILYAPELVRDPAQFSRMVSARMVYCALLATGLSASFLRALERKSAAARPWYRQIYGGAAAILFFALIHIWNFHAPEVTLAQRADALLSLFSPE